MLERLRRMDAWSERTAWMILALILLGEAAVQWWIGAVFWPRWNADPDGGCLGVDAWFCDPASSVQSRIARALGWSLAIAGGFASMVHFMGRTRTARSLPPTFGLLARWLVGSTLMVMGTMFIIAVQGPPRTCPDGCPDLMSLHWQHWSFAVTLIAAGLNLFPRRLPERDGASTPSR